MCGISCVVGPSNSDGSSRSRQSETLKAQLDASLDLIAHRGPDARGKWTSDDGFVGLAHCRLSINDLRPAASQPLHSSSNKIHAVVNGELYDYAHLRESLTKNSGYQFQTNSDSEIALALYENFGLDFLQHLRGEFAICIYDEQKRLFIAARDRYGIKPLFWTFHQGRLLVAAEIKAFLGLGWQAEWDVPSLVEGGWNFDDRTIFKGVRKLKPGHYLTYDENHVFQMKQYWDIEYAKKTELDSRADSEMIANVREHLVDAIRQRLRADVPIGIYLSGGIDSSAIAGIAAHLVKEKGARMGSAAVDERICCFSIAFEKESGFDESDIAERTAQWLNVRYLKQEMTEDAFATRFEDATWHCEHHNFDLNYVGKFALSELPREYGYKVVLTGEGADEHFGGYPLYQPDFLAARDSAWKHTSMTEDHRKQLKEELEQLISGYFTTIGGDSRCVQGSAATPALGNIMTPAYMSAFHFDAFASWTTKNCEADARIIIANGISKDAQEKMQRKWHPLHSAMYTWSKGHLANNFLSCLGDRTEMAHSIEARPPFLDHKLTEYVNYLPPSVKVRHDATTNRLTEKWILREAARPFITDELYQRRKHPYTAPTKWPTDGPLHQLFQRLLTKENVEKLGFIDWSVVEPMVDAAFGDTDIKALRLCLLVGQWVVLGQRFNVSTARPSSTGS